MKILVLLEYGIENKTNDLDNLYLRSYSNCCGYDKVFKQTFMLKRRAYYEYLLQGNVLGNNINVFNEKSEFEGFSGAVVANPLLNSNTGVKLLGFNSMYVYDWVIDMDFSAMYPHTTVAFNIERHTMIGKLFIPEFTDEMYDHTFISTDVIDDSDDEDDEDDGIVMSDSTYDSGKDFIEGYLSGDILSLCNKWFNLPSYDDLYEEFKTEYKIKPRSRLSFPRIKETVKAIFNLKI